MDTSKNDIIFYHTLKDDSKRTGDNTFDLLKDYITNANTKMDEQQEKIKKEKIEKEKIEKERIWKEEYAKKKQKIKEKRLVRKG